MDRAGGWGQSSHFLSFLLRMILYRAVIIPVLDPNPAIPIPGFYRNYNSSTVLLRTDVAVSITMAPRRRIHWRSKSFGRLLHRGTRVAKGGQERGGLGCQDVGQEQVRPIKGRVN